MQRSRIRFIPVELKARHDGWTAARQFRFIEALAATRSVALACKAVGMTRAGAYKLRDRAGAAQFRRAWDLALRPDFERERPRSPRGARRLGRRLRRRRKVDEMKEMDAPPDSRGGGQATSSALATLETLLAKLRAHEQGLGSAPGD